MKRASCILSNNNGEEHVGMKCDINTMKRASCILLNNGEGHAGMKFDIDAPTDCSCILFVEARCSDVLWLTIKSLH